ncbi:MAG: DUF1320 family protein [Gloeomargarita sp. SKYB31]|nr:DUF1320 family protein [Gloeomargarita sp. SKYB31]
MYCTRADIEMIFGAHNVAVWADLNSTGNPAEIDARIAHAIQLAEAEVNSILANSMYQVPIASQAETTPILIREVTATLAGVYLFEGRGIKEVSITQDGLPIHPYSMKRLWALQVLQDLQAGRRRLPELV